MRGWDRRVLPASCPSLSFFSSRENPSSSWYRTRARGVLGPYGKQHRAG